jgi:hypothetical protein
MLGKVLQFRPYGVESFVWDFCDILPKERDSSFGKL